MYAIIDLETGHRIGQMSSTPNIVVTLPDGGTAHFTELGQTEPGHAPRYRMVEVEEATPRPEYPVIETAPADYRYDTKLGKVIVTRTFAPDQTAFTNAIEDHIETVAREKGYSSAVSCASYLNDPDPVWAAEAQAFIAWRSAVWAKAFEMLAAVQGGKDIPSVSGMIAGLPVIKWPQA